MSLSDETFEWVSNGPNDGQKMREAAQRHKQGKQAASQKYNPVGSLQQMAERQMSTKMAMGSHTREQDSQTKFRKQTVITKDEPYQMGR